MSDRVDGKLMYTNLPKWDGKCANPSPAKHLEGQHVQPEADRRPYFTAGWGGDPVPTRVQLATRYERPRHHIATTSAGNFGVQATGPTAGFGKISGIAPRARIAAYKVCWRADVVEAGGQPTASPPSTRRWPTAST